MLARAETGECGGAFMRGPLFSIGMQKAPGGVRKAPGEKIVKPRRTPGPAGGKTRGLPKKKRCFRKRKKKTGGGGGGGGGEHPTTMRRGGKKETRGESLPKRGTLDEQREAKLIGQYVGIACVAQL